MSTAEFWTPKQSIEYTGSALLPLSRANLWQHRLDVTGSMVGHAATYGEVKTNCNALNDKSKSTSLFGSLIMVHASSVFERQGTEPSDQEPIMDNLVNADEIVVVRGVFREFSPVPQHDGPGFAIGYKLGEPVITPLHNGSTGHNLPVSFQPIAATVKAFIR